MDEISSLLAQMREYETQVFIHGPASEDVIQQLEFVFGRRMPPSYRRFLARFGGFSIIGWCYSGISDGKIDTGSGCSWTNTKRAREWCQLPEHYLVVQPDEDGFACLDFSRVGPDDEHPMVYHMPFRNTPFNELGVNYEVWLTEDLQAMVAAWAEDSSLGN